ncbi:MAG: sugar phosphate isomerase/epimerase [Asgard group archaeon]|nr:sugar phosphate isomerase/epimerase [Asgard group archaeon]
MKLGISLVMGFSDKTNINDFLQLAYKKELSIVELVTEPPFCFVDDLNITQRNEIKKLADDLQIELTVHSSFSDINIAAINENVRTACVNIIKKSIQFAADVNASFVTIHPGERSVGGFYYPDEVKQKNLTSVLEISKFAQKFNIDIGYENFPIMPWELLEESYVPTLIREFIEKINLPNLGITWDIGHSNTTKYTLDECYSNFKDHLFHLHFHDNNGTGSGWLDTHAAVGKGTVDWEKLIELLKQMNYQRTCVFELSSIKKIDESLDFLSQYL